MDIETTTPTTRTYNGLNAAFNLFNERLFDGALPGCLITMQRKNRAYGYFCGGRFSAQDGGDVTDEIALNPKHFKGRSSREILSTLVHEMVHLWQHHYGKPSRSRYHNKEWAAKMKTIGLYPSSTGKEGGAEVGQRMSHYILRDELFDVACEKAMACGYAIPYVERRAGAKSGVKGASKTKYSCPSCGLNAWAKPQVQIICGSCHQGLLPEENASDTEIENSVRLTPPQKEIRRASARTPAARNNFAHIAI